MTSPAQVPSLANERERRRESLRDGYLPPAQLVVDPSLQFHAGADEDVDVVTYEVVRSKLWNLNVDHSETIRRVSGSSIVVEGYDFNCAITTSLGDAVTLSPYSMFFAGFADEVIKWTLEHRSMNVGIRDGDVFLQDDPWVGSNHQMDAAVFGPVFVDGGLFAWIFNCVHQRELGGRYPGGFIQDASDVYEEPTFLPPIKLAEGGVVREDVVDMWTRRSRLPELMTLELNSQVAGFNVARQRLIGMVERYGAGAVKATMDKMIRDTAAAVGSRLAQLPDATWRDERYVAGATPGDLRLFKLCLAFDKRGERLTVSNAGTDPAVGSINTAPGVFRAAVLNGLLPALAYDQYLCAAGVLRQLDFELQRGAINSASHPSAVSASLGSVATINQAQLLTAKMVSGHAQLAEHAFASSTFHTISNNSLSWLDGSGNRVGDVILDMCAGGLGAFNHRDGIDFAGSALAVANHFSDVEKFEQAIPFLYLYRRELPDSGGHGRWRGGATLAAAWVGHRNDSLTMSTSGFLKSVTMGLGVCGGLPASGGYHWHAVDTDVQAWFRQGRVPGGPDELRVLAPHGRPAPLSLENRLSSHDVFELFPNPGAGWGDVLDRDPLLVASDLVDGRVDARDADARYGVVIDDQGQLDVVATRTRREALRTERLSRARPPRRLLGRTVDAPADGATVVEGVGIVTTGDGTCFACTRCGALLSPVTETYRLGCAELDLELPDISHRHLSPRQETGEALVVRQWLCPQCATVIDAHVCRPDDDPYTDVSIGMRTGPDERDRHGG